MDIPVELQTGHSFVVGAKSLFLVDFVSVTSSTWRWEATATFLFRLCGLMHISVEALR